MNFKRLMPQSVMSRLAWVLVLGIITVQVVGNIIWVSQIRQEVIDSTEKNTENLTDAISNTVRYLIRLPNSYRAIAMEQLREAGGTRFYISLHEDKINITGLPSSKLSELVSTQMRTQLEREWAPKFIEVKLASPLDLVVRENGTLLTDSPAYISSQHLILSPKPAPLVVVQIELEEGAWVYLAALMPDPFFLDNYQPLSFDQFVVQSLTGFTLLVLLFFIVRSITRPMNKLSIAAELFGRGEAHEAIDTRGTREYTKLATTFNIMEERIQRYINDRERVFRSISHDLRTPITRLKLRSELLDDEAMVDEFNEDLDDLELMVIGALQILRDSDIHENTNDIDINKLIQKLITPMHQAGQDVTFNPVDIRTIRAKPLALKRSITNLLDNAIFYGERAKVTVWESEGDIAISIRDYGPGIDEDTDKVFEPFTRLQHGKDQREGGFGLGLNIAQHLILGQGGRLVLRNHDSGGLVATIYLPIA